MISKETCRMPNGPAEGTAQRLPCVGLGTKASTKIRGVSEKKNVENSVKGIIENASGFDEWKQEYGCML